ncbi:MAG: transposase [Selenomonadaceae bacterium]|nr:transposase [Selenomonadaceae bacterium]
MVAYVILAIKCDGRKEVLSIEIGENESAKYWLGVLNSLKNRGLKDILILCADGLTGSLMPSRPTRKHRKFY